MTLNMEKVKYIIFEFDSVLCSWNQYTGINEEWFEVQSMSGKISPYEIEGNKRRPYAYSVGIFEKLLPILYKEDKRFYICSETDSCPLMLAKQNWAEFEYKVSFGNICVAHGISKAVICSRLAKSLLVEHEEILYVDYNKSVLSEMEYEGFQVVTPVDLADYYVCTYC